MLNFVRRLPGVQEASTVLAGVERAMIRAIQWHINELDPRTPLPATSDAEEARRVVVEDAPPLTLAMQALLDRALNDSPAESRAAMHEALIHSLVPDEARILSALSDGSCHPLIHVAEPGIGGNRKCVLRNASSVGRAAGVTLPDRTSIYVSRLLRLGLADSGDEDIELRAEYEILLTDPVVREAMSSVAKGPLSARVVRHTLRISDLGRELWCAAQ